MNYSQQYKSKKKTVALIGESPQKKDGRGGQHQTTGSTPNSLSSLREK